MTITPRPDSRRVLEDIEALARIVDPSQPGWTRRPFTPWYGQARTWLAEQMVSADLEVHTDAASNLVGRLPGLEPSLPPIVVGSHIDTVSGGGRFDGIMGVVAGLEIARLLKETGISLRHPLEVIDFTAEEPTDFGISTVGSRGMAANLTDEMLSRTDPQGRTLRQVILAAGGRPDAIAPEARRPGDITVYLELHIEQGPILEQTKKVLGAVTGIVGINRYRLVVDGQPDHAGTTPMTIRFDALTAAAEMVLALEAICRESYAVPVVGTVGRLHVAPNAANVVPGQVDFLAEIRTIDDALNADLASRFAAKVQAIASSRNVKVSLEPVTQTKAVRVSPDLLAIVDEACKETDARSLLLPSGAGHDANQMTTLGPVGMIFTPSRGGRSHCPEEFTPMDQVATGVEALFRAVLLCDERM